jgi:hypothetical protein
MYIPLSMTHESRRIRRPEKAEKYRLGRYNIVCIGGGRRGMRRHVCVEAQAVDPYAVPRQPAGRVAHERCDDATFPSLRLLYTSIVLMIAWAVFWGEISDVTAAVSLFTTLGDRRTTGRQHCGGGYDDDDDVTTTASVPLLARNSHKSHSNPVAYHTANVVPVRARFTRRRR